MLTFSLIHMLSVHIRNEFAIHVFVVMLREFPIRSKMLMLLSFQEWLLLMANEFEYGPSETSQIYRYIPY